MIYGNYAGHADIRSVIAPPERGGKKIKCGVSLVFRKSSNDES